MWMDYASKGHGCGEEFRFICRKTPDAMTEWRHVRPVHSAFVNGQWDHFRHDLKRKAAGCFGFSGMSRVSSTGRKFERSSSPEIPPPPRARRSPSLERGGAPALRTFDRK